MNAHLSLARGALEGAVTCRWLIEPTATPHERRRRAAIAQLIDHRERSAFEKDIRADAARSRSGVNRHAEQEKQMTKLGMDPKTRVTAMVELFDRYSAGAWLYRMLSSHAHGKQWGVLTSTRVEIEPLAAFPDLTSARVSADDKVTVVAAFHAIRGLRMALEERMHYLGYALSTELPG